MPPVRKAVAATIEKEVEWLTMNDVQNALGEVLLPISVKTVDLQDLANHLMTLYPPSIARDLAGCCMNARSAKEQEGYSYQTGEFHNYELKESLEMSRFNSYDDEWARRVGSSWDGQLRYAHCGISEEDAVIEMHSITRQHAGGFDAVPLCQDCHRKTQSYGKRKNIWV